MKVGIQIFDDAGQVVLDTSDNVPGVFGAQRFELNPKYTQIPREITITHPNIRPGKTWVTAFAPALNDESVGVYIGVGLIGPLKVKIERGKISIKPQPNEGGWCLETPLIVHYGGI